ncbi:hypothetical protein [Aquiflexum gelatinilyticum]|uniref:hypothetical protein n=1 Tax=Aquiflexum gelatinilyticum TaxID=2961943 RepID=UPI002169CA05|nr:hypothetical protein [Aquiflexum gelatinilyticum]MCS4436493.1 hypothetical protein [Aquiflexum gelatinilyticum]
MEKLRYLNIKVKYILILAFLSLSIYVLAVYPFIKDRAKLEQYARQEFNYRFKGTYRDSFLGPFFSFEDDNGVEFSWFLSEGCDTTFIYIYVPKQLFTEVEMSGFDKECEKNDNSLTHHQSLN